MLKLKHIFPWIKLKTPNLKWYNKFYIYIESCLAIVMMAWTLWIFVGLKLVFSHEYIQHGIHFYTPYELSKHEKEKLNQIVAHSKAILSKTKIDTEKINADVRIEKNDFYYKLSLVPGMQFTRFGSAVTLEKYIFLPNSSIEKNLFYSQTGVSNELNIVFMHELIHVWQNKKYGFGMINLHTKPTWGIEGYATYASEDVSPKLKTEDGIRKFLQKYFNSSRYSYDLWRLMVKHAIEKMHKSVDDLHLGKVDYDEVLDSLLQEYNITR